MEAVTAVGLASNVAQFLSHGITGLRLFKEIISNADGTPKHISELQDITNHMTQTLDGIKETQALISRDIERDRTLLSIVDRSLELCRKVDQILKSIHTKHLNGKLRFMEGAYRAARAMYKKEELEQLSVRLLSLRTEVSSHLIILIEQQQRDIQQNLRKFFDDTDIYRELFGQHMGSSMQYLRNIEKRLDTLAVDKNNLWADGRAVLNWKDERPIVNEGPESTALRAYVRNVENFYSTSVVKKAEEKRKSILQTLNFDQLHERELAIPEAHRRTFQWIFSSNMDQGRSFLEWLRTQNGVFWINGKAGSGKSTLMKFITEHRITNNCLEEWADPFAYKLAIAKHYFWSPGVTIQKSQEGLLRSLLLQILNQHPYLIESVCEDRWSADYTESFTPWTWARLSKAMMALAQPKKHGQAAKPGRILRICLFIDGLDEYEGDHTDLIEFLFRLSRSPNVKICTSSRAWIEFADAFDSSQWKMCMHELTSPDIRQFVQDSLEGHARFKRLQIRSRDAASDLIRRIISRSEGVFLWVYLVVRSLLRGLRNEDNLSTLRQRVDALPSDLEKFFERILSSVEDIYRERAARLFLTLSYARRSFPVFTFLFFNFDQQPVEAQAQELAFLGDWPRVDSAPLDTLLTKKRQLIAQCKDMIHIAPDSHAPVLFGERVSFLHRTIVDYIHTEQTSAYLHQLAGDFDPRTLLFDAYLGQSRALMGQHRLSYIKPNLRQWVLACLFYAYEIEVSSSEPCKQVNEGLDELEKIVSQTFARWDFSEGMLTILGEKFSNLIQLAAKCDLATYVQHRLPDATADTLDEVAPGWRSPYSIVQDADFEMRPNEGFSWRIGQRMKTSEIHAQPPGIPGSPASELAYPRTTVRGREMPMASTEHEDASTSPQTQRDVGEGRACPLPCDSLTPNGSEVRKRRRGKLLRMVVDIFH